MLGVYHLGKLELDENLKWSGKKRKQAKVGNLHQSNSSELNLTKARPTFEEESHFETPAAVDFPRIKEEVQPFYKLRTASHSAGPSKSSWALLLTSLPFTPVTIDSPGKACWLLLSSPLWLSRVCLTCSEVSQVTTSSVYLVLILADQGGQRTSDPPGDRCFPNSYRHSEILADEDDFDHTFSSKCSLVMSTEDIKLKAEKSFDDNDLVTCISTEEQFPSRENISRTIDLTTNNLPPNTHRQHNYVMLSESLSAPCKIPAIHDQVNGEYNYDKQYVQENSMDTHNMEVAYTKNCQELFKSEGSTNMPFSITNTSSSKYENIQQLVQETIERSIDKSSRSSSNNMQFPITNKSSYDHETIQQLSPENIKRSVDESIVNTPFTITNTSFSNNENIQLLAQENTEGSFDEPPMNIFNSHHMNLSGVNVDIESHLGPDATKDHKKLHRSKNPRIFTCEECHKQFSRHSGLRIHLLIHKGEKPYKCEDCGKYFRDRTSLRRHRQRIHHDAINNYVCPNCNKVYFERSVFLKHMEKESGTKRFHCKECNKSYTEMSSYRRHARLHGGKKPFKCDLCNRRFTAICNVRQHMLTQHSSVLPFQCPECDKSFPRKYLFKKHVEEHSSKILAQENTERSLDESLVNMSSHQMNLNVVHNHIENDSRSATTNMSKTKDKPIKPKIYICEECHRQFSRLSGLKTHLLIHKGEKPCKCKDCGRNFRDKTILRRHRQRIHHDTTVSYKCPNCDKIFFEKSYLLRHLQNESDEKRFHCKECNKGYTEMSSYKRHVRLHGGNKPFKCDLCNKRFTAIGNVRQHKLTQHSHIYPFKCPECGSKFSRKFLLKKHVEKHSSEIVILLD
uniref:(California timema) hypothetical protein n=1 Tax=Timema californicum TaxID=61474 RepID=A0A7R9P501_TIMCA|nr:unnamed protein product [Timema californicum]